MTRLVQCASLDEVRQQIDRVDRELVSLIAERGHYVRQAAGLKKTAAEIPAPQRVAQVLARVDALAQESGADPAVVAATWRAMIAAFIEAEQSTHALLHPPRQKQVDSESAMSIPAAYLGIVLIWSTTPLAIQWSTQGAGFAFAVLARMLIGVVVAALLLAVWRIGLPLHARARRAYLVGGLGLFGAMALTYWGARYIHSGLVSVLFGLSPLMAGVLAALWLGERALTRLKVGGMLLGAGGLAVIFLHGDSLGGEHALAGLAALLAAVFIYSACLVWLKRIGDDSPPLATTVGTLTVSLPLFALVWLFTDGHLPAAVPPRTGAAIAYLGVFGSVIGFALYYYVIKHMEASKVALITLVTPVIALLLGHVLNGETIGLRLGLGTALILCGLTVHQWETLASLRLARGRAGD